MCKERHAYSAGQAVVATFGRTLGCNPTRPVPFWTFCAGLMVIDW